MEVTCRESYFVNVPISYQDKQLAAMVFRETVTKFGGELARLAYEDHLVGVNSGLFHFEYDQTAWDYIYEHASAAAYSAINADNGLIFDITW